MKLPISGFTTPPNQVADAVIAGHMARIRDVILARGAGRLSAIVLTGGFGRGEGGIEQRPDGSWRPVNDYDILAVTRGNSLLTRLWLRRRLKQNEPSLFRELGIRVDIACKTPAILERLAPTVEAYEMAVGHKVLWGEPAALERIRWRDSADLPASEAVRYLYNRGAALLWSRLILEETPQPAEERRRFVLVALHKAWLAWGDAVLLVNRRYAARYAGRQALLEEVRPDLDMSLNAGGQRFGTLAEIYAEALRFKLQPDFGRWAAADLVSTLAETIRRHEQIWRWVEARRGQRVLSWQEYLHRPAPVLSAPAGLAQRLYHAGLNLWRIRSLSLPFLFAHPDERLARALPLLLFNEDDSQDAAARRALATLLGAPANATPRQLSRRFITIWHPGSPFLSDSEAKAGVA
jgi:hypothetical protein